MSVLSATRESNLAQNVACRWRRDALTRNQDDALSNRALRYHDVGIFPHGQVI